MRTTPSTVARRARLLAGALAIAVVLATTACGDPASSEPAPAPTTTVDPTARETTEIGRRLATTALDPTAVEEDDDLPRLVVSERARDDAVAALGHTRLGAAADDDASAALEQLDLAEDIGVLRVFGSCGTTTLPLEATADGSRLIERFEHLEVLCEAYSVSAELWTVPRDGLAEQFSIGEADVREPGDVRADGDTLVTPDVFTYAAIEIEPADVALEAGDEPVVTVIEDDAVVADVLERAGNRPDLGLEQDPSAYLAVVVETGGAPCTVPRAALLGRRLSLWHPSGECTEEHVARRSEILVPLDRLGDELVVGFGESLADADQVIDLS